MKRQCRGISMPLLFICHPLFKWSARTRTDHLRCGPFLGQKEQRGCWGTETEIFNWKISKKSVSKSRIPRRWWKNSEYKGVAFLSTAKFISPAKSNMTQWKLASRLPIWESTNSSQCGNHRWVWELSGLICKRAAYALHACMHTCVRVCVCVARAQMRAN